MLSQEVKILTCFCPDCQSLNVNQLYYILIQNSVTLIPKFKPPERAQLLNMMRSYNVIKHIFKTEIKATGH